MSEAKKTVAKPKMWRRVTMSVIGVILCAISVAIFKFAALGVDPFQSLVAGLDALIPLSFGTVYALTNAVLLIFVIFTEWHYVGFATLINLFFLGYITEFVHGLLIRFIPDPALWVRIVSLAAGILLICLALSFYMTANLGVSAYDAIALIVVNKWNKGKLSWMRIVTDLCCVILGTVFFLLSGGKIKEVPTLVGIGTIIAAFFMGPLIAFFNRHVSERILFKKKA